MRRGLLMSKKGRRAVLLTKDGVFKKVKLRKSAQVSVGEEIYLHHLSVKTERERKKWLTMVAVCLSLLFLFVLSGGVYQPHASAAAYVSFDVNPSVEASIDEHLHIIRVHPMNKAAESLLGKPAKYKHMALGRFTEELASDMKAGGYFTDHPELVVTTTLNDQVNKTNRAKILNGISHALKKIKTQQVFVTGEGTLRTLTATEEKRSKAMSAGLSTGKYLIYKEAVNEKRAISLQEAKSMSIKEIDQPHSKSISEDKNKKNQHQETKAEEQNPATLKNSSHNNHSPIHKDPAAHSHKKTADVNKSKNVPIDKKAQEASMHKKQSENKPKSHSKNNRPNAYKRSLNKHKAGKPSEKPSQKDHHPDPHSSEAKNKYTPKNKHSDKLYNKKTPPEKKREPSNKKSEHQDEKNNHKK